MKVDVARPRNADALGNLAGGLTELFGQLETGGDRELSHFDGRRIAQGRHTRVNAKDLANDLDKPVANFLVEFQVQAASSQGSSPYTCQPIIAERNPATATGRQPAAAHAFTGCFFLWFGGLP